MEELIKIAKEIESEREALLNLRDHLTSDQRNTPKLAELLTRQASILKSLSSSLLFQEKNLPDFAPGTGDWQNEILLSINTEIAAIRGKQDLLNIIQTTLRQHVDFDDSFILRYNKANRSCKPYIYHAKERRSETPQFNSYLDVEYPVVDDGMENAHQPIIYDVASLVPGGSEQISFMHQAGIKEFVVIKLLQANELRGLFVLLSERQNAFETKDLEFLQRISYPIAIATANIIANEEIAAREEEKSLLLALTSEIAAVRNRNELLNLLNARLTKIFPIAGFGITLANSNGYTHSPFVVDVHEQLKTQDYEATITQEYPINDGVYNSIINSPAPIRLNVEELLNLPEAPAYVSFWKSIEVKQVTGIPIRTGERILGCFILCLDGSSQYLSESLFIGVASQISVAIANILANDEIEKREKEKTILLALSNEISSLKSRTDLFQVVNERVKKLFSITELSFAEIYEDGKTYGPFMMDLEQRIVNHPDFVPVTTGTYYTSDPLFSRAMNAEDPIVFEVQELIADPNMPAYVHFWNDVGLRRVLCSGLRAGGKNIGMAFFHVDANDSINPRSTLLKGICSQLSVAISNILANESVRKADEEKSLLLAFSNDMATVRDRKGLGVIVKQYLKNIFLIKEYILTIRNKDGSAYNYFLHDQQGDQHLNDHNDIEHTNIVVDSALTAAVLESAEPLKFYLDEVFKGENFSLSAASVWKTGQAEKIMAVRLKVADEDFGLLFIEPNQVNEALLKGISAQLAIALSNIMANEEIKSRETERELLLSLNIDISGVRNNNDLLIVINQGLKQLLSFSHSLIATVNEDESTVSAFLLDPDSRNREHPIYAAAKKTNYPISDGVIDKAMAQAKPVLIDMDELYKGQGLPVYLKVNYENGIRKVVVVRFAKGKKVFGFWMIFFDQHIGLDQRTLSLVEGLANQMSIAVSNIIANENISDREAEKSRLLAFSNAMASVKDKQVLAKVLKQQLKELFAIEDYVIHALSSDKKTHRPILFDHEANFASHPDFEKLINSNTDVNDGIFNKILSAEYAVTFNVEEWFESAQPPTYANAAKHIGLKKMTAVPIRLGNENIGTMNFRHDEKNQFAIEEPLFKSICSQLAITISNIVANDDIKKREEEKSRLLAFSNAIASVRDKYVLAKILKQQLYELFSIKDYLINELVDDKKRFVPLLYDAESDFIKEPSFQRILNTPSDINDGVFDKILQSEEPVSFNTKEWNQFERPLPYGATAAAIGMSRMTGVRIRLGQEDIAILNFRHDDFELTSEQHRLLKSICSQIAIAVSNIIANERVLKQLAEINRYKQQLEDEKVYLKEEIENTQNFSEMIGDSQEMKKVFRLVAQVAPSDSTVLLLGETGTGKELIARAIHNSSPRKNKLMVKVNCAALPANLIESELFGHERGSFTGATDRRIGKFELANNGTLFLDEIGEMPLELQVKLLRALQEKEIERVGGRTTIKVDARIIAATNRDLAKLMDEGKFRSDLYYRLNIFPIHLPPLRERKEDIPELAKHFIRRFSKKAGRQINTLGNKVLKEMIDYSWPGNIRELEHLIERSVLLSSGDTIKEIHLPSHKSTGTTGNQQQLIIKTIDENERDYILKIVKHAKGRISGEGGAAELLGLPPSTLSSRMKRLGIRKEHLG